MNKKERLRELRKYNNNEKRMRNFNFNSLLLLIIIFGLGGIAYFLYDNGYFSEQNSSISSATIRAVPVIVATSISKFLTIYKSVSTYLS